MKIRIKNTNIGNGEKTFVVAELSANHNHDFNCAAKTIRAMKRAGADAVKLQTYTADTLTIDSDRKYFKIKQDTPWDKKTFYKLYKEAYTPWDWQPKLKKLADDMGIILFSSPFDRSAVDFLEKINVPAYKIASFEITDIPLIEYVASKGRPVIISTGIAKKTEIREAVEACRNQGNNQIALLKCTSAYPAPYNEMNLSTIPDMAKTFKTVAGLSDHSTGSTAAISAVSLGAKIIEKHFILDKKIGGPDSGFSMEPKEFKRMVETIRDTEEALGKITYKLSGKSLKSREFSRSLFVIQDIKKNEIFTDANVRSIRPGFGLAPKNINKILGKKARSDLKRGTPLSWEMID